MYTKKYIAWCMLSLCVSGARASDNEELHKSQPKAPLAVSQSASDEGISHLLEQYAELYTNKKGHVDWAGIKKELYHRYKGLKRARENSDPNLRPFEERALEDVKQALAQIPRTVKKKSPAKV